MASWNPRANEIFASVLELPPAQRQVALDRACGADADLRGQVEQLLAAHAAAGSFLDRPAPGAAPLLDEPTTGPDPDLPLPVGGSVVQALAASLAVVPRVHLRDPAVEALTPVARYGTDNLPGNQSAGDRLQLHGEIARGGMGAILKGRDVDLGRDVAIKVLLEAHKGKADLVQRFVEEAQIAGQLQHPGVVPVYELGQLAGGRPYFTMKLVKGKTLAALLAARAEPTEERVRFVGIFALVCQTLAYAHARGVIHRDLKPANVMVGAFGEVQVMDWGLAKVLAEGGIADEKKALQHHTVSIIRTRRSAEASEPEGIGSHTVAGSILGTPAYASPEQARGEVELVDERADVFGLGAILCEILTGQPPYVGKKAEVLRKAQTAHLDDAFARLDGCDADAELIGLAKRCLAAEPWDRPRDASQVAEAVTAYQNSVAERLRQAELAQAAETARAKEAQATAKQERLAREAAQARAAAERRARQLFLGLAASVLLSVVLGSGVWLWVADQRAARERESLTRAAEISRKVQDTLAQAAELREQALATHHDQTKWAEALSLAKSAKTLLENGPTDPELGERVRALLHKLDEESNERQLLVRLDEIQRIKSETGLDSVFYTGVRASGFAEQRGLTEYNHAFTASGLNVLEMPVDEVARKLRERPPKVRQVLVAALNDWLDLAQRYKASEADRLARVLDTADPDPWRQELRSALARDDWAALYRLAATEKFKEQQPQTIVLLARRLWSRYPNRAGEVLRVAQQRFPSDFWINHLLSMVIFHRVSTTFADRAEFDEAIRFATVAQALRPNNPRVLDYLRFFLFIRGRYDEALLYANMAIEREPNEPGSWDYLSNVWRAKGDNAKADAARQEAIARRPKAPGADNKPGGTQLWSEGRIDEAIMVHRRFINAVEVPLWVVVDCTNLGGMLFEKGRFNEAAATYQKAVAWNPELARVPDLGLLITTGRADEAIALCRKAIAEQPSDAVAHAGIAKGLQTQGKFEGSLAAFRRARELSPKRANLGAAPWARWIREAEQMVAIDNQWPAYAGGKVKPRDQNERRLLTRYCVIRKQYLFAARLHAEALTEDPQWANDLNAEAHYDAARFAALVAAGQGEDTGKLDAAERIQWRKQAVNRLRDELTRQSKHLESTPELDRRVALSWLRWWQQEPDLAAIRDPDALAKLPAEERDDCRKLWAEVETVLRKADGKK
jgi:serine/threonine-protein kinase